MILVVYLVSLLAALIGFLRWRETPRRDAFQIVLASVWIFVISAWSSMDAVDKNAPSHLDGFVPFVPPVLPVVIFVAYMLRRRRAIRS